MRSERASQGCSCPKLLSALSDNAAKDGKIERLERENARLRQELGKIRRTALEKPFGLSTPSSKQLVKPDTAGTMTDEDRIRRRGGGRKGHVGHGWKKLEEPIETEELAAPTECPHCHGELIDAPFDPDETRDVVVTHPVKAYVRRYHYRIRYCPHCRKPVRARLPGVMDGCRYSNGVIARAAVDFYFHGIPVGVVARTMDVGKNTLLGIFNRVAGMFAPVRERLFDRIRLAPFVQCDETGWRIDGSNGWTWVFISGNIVAYVCADTRGSVVAKNALDGFKGLCLTDRYGGYAFLRHRAFCLEHLKRDALKIAEENPDDKECTVFVEAVVPVLKDIMKLRGKYGETPKVYRRQALKCAGRLYALVSAPARHPCIQQFQDVFRDRRLTCWQWLIGPTVPAENNRSEREIRPVAGSRKSSHGSQSRQGAETRGIFMTIFHTLKACGIDPQERFETTLNAFTENPAVDLYDVLFRGLDLKLPELGRGLIRKLPKAVTQASTESVAM